MHTVDLIIAIGAGLGVAMALASYRVRRSWIDEPLLALALGILIGPGVLGWLDIADYADEVVILEFIARLTLAVALVSVGVELRGWLDTNLRSVAVLVVGGAAVMWGISSTLVWLIFGIGLLEALLIGAVLAPVDPILAATITTGRIAREHVPERIRKLLTAESSARHGIGLIFVLLPAWLLTKSEPDAVQHWLIYGLVWKGIAAIAIGGLLGDLVGRAHRRGILAGWTDQRGGSLIALYLALALSVVAFVEFIGSDGILAALVAGIAYARHRRDDDPELALERQQREYVELVKQLLQVPVFLALGTALPWEQWREHGWSAVVLIISVLALRRLPAILALAPRIAPIRNWSETLFISWFGPIGVGAIYFAAVAHEVTHFDLVWEITTLLVAVTIVTHGVTATPLSQWLGRRANESR